MFTQHTGQRQPSRPTRASAPAIWAACHHVSSHLHRSARGKWARVSASIRYRHAAVRIGAPRAPRDGAARAAVPMPDPTEAAR